MNYFYSLQNVAIQFSIVPCVFLPVEYFILNLEVHPIPIKSTSVLPTS